MPRFSNVGGVLGLGPVDTTDSHRPWEWVWEARVWALNAIVPPRFGHSTDEKRDRGEQLSAVQHMELGYYERWLARLELMLVEDGVLLPGELDAAVAEAERHQVEGHRDWEHESGAGRPWPSTYE